MTARALQLSRPLVAFDLETTGLDIDRDRIVELSFIKVFPDGARETRTRRLDPGMPIPPAATAVHGISDADVAGCPHFAQVAKNLHEWLRGCDLTGYNIERFDLRLIAAEFKRVGIAFPDEGTCIVDAYTIFARKESRDLAAALRFFCDRELVGAHSAQADTEASLDVLLGQLSRYDDLPSDVAALHAWCHPRDPSWVDATGKLVWDADGQAAIGFGKHKGRTLHDMVTRDPGYLRWMLGSDFPSDVKDLLSAALRGDYPVRPAEPVDGPTG